jgi:hypothetical protein
MAELEWMMLANYAEAPQGNGLMYIMGGAWDTLNVAAPLEGAPPGIVAAVVGTLAIRLLFHMTETGRDHEIAITLMDEDGGQVGALTASFRVERTPGLPAEWMQGTNLVIPISGMGLPRFGIYTFNLSLDGRHVGDRPFRVLKLY